MKPKKKLDLDVLLHTCHTWLFPYLQDIGLKKEYIYINKET